MRHWLLILAAAAVGCSSEGGSTSTGTRTTGTMAGGSGGASGGSGGASGGSGGSGGMTGGSGGATGGTGGTGGAGGTGGNTGGASGTGGATGGSSGAAGKGGMSGTGGSGGGGTDAGRDAPPDTGTGGTGGSGMDASTRPDATMEEVQACTNFANAFCDRLQVCSSFVMSVLYGDATTCKSRWVLSCLPNFGITGTSATPARTSSCAQSIPNIACDKFINGDFPTECLAAPGQVPLGGGCGDDAQCTTSFCARSATSACGTCQPTTIVGDPCIQGSCSVATNTVCPAGGTKCIKPKAGKVGDACTAQEECDVGNQVGCNTVTSKTCIALTLSTGTCGANNPLSPTSVAVCGNGGTCSGPFAGSCAPVAQDGQACMTGDTGSHCRFPAKCIGGTCVVPDPGTCK